MRIVHLCLSCFYIDGFSYQENELVRQHVVDGHTVLVIASTETYGADGRLTYVAPSDYIGSDGARVIRLPYRRWLPHPVMKKLRMHPDVRRLLLQFDPDAMLFHGLCGWELRTVARYKRRNPTVKLYVDSHEDHNNSAKTFVSKNFLHKGFYAAIVRSEMRYFEKILCVSLDTMTFVNATYGVPSDLLEFYPLGGHIYSDIEYEERRKRGRADAMISDDQVMLLQTGKMGRRKKVLESLEAFVATPGEYLRYVIAGSFDDEIEDEAHTTISVDARVRYLGWRASSQLQDLLCAADVYVQPGTQSATMQMSVCARCPVVLDDVLSHRPFVEGNGWLIRDQRGLLAAFKQIQAEPHRLADMSQKSLEIARALLDYKALAQRVLN